MQINVGRFSRFAPITDQLLARIYPILIDDTDQMINNNHRPITFTVDTDRYITYIYDNIRKIRKIIDFFNVDFLNIVAIEKRLFTFFF